MTMPRTWDIFCRVVDNYGDAGVCWRLARRLAARGATVRLWIDDLSTLRQLHPHVTADALQFVEGIEIRALRGESSATDTAQVVIEAFGCGLPEAYAGALAHGSPQSLWIVLEYLSAEPWVREHHLLPSPHPRLDVRRYFFFPGFTEGTGGLLREPDLFARRDVFGDNEQRNFWRTAGFDALPANAMTVSLFGYESAPVSELLEVWERSALPMVTAVPEGRLLPSVLAHCGLSRIPEDRVIDRGALQVRIMPFVPQARYDELLWSCDINFVRGEDSFVRAQWAARPFVWQIYPQKDGSHGKKLEAFLDRYCEAAPASVKGAVNALMMNWNGTGGPATLARSWADFSMHWEEIGSHTCRWADRLAALGDLADKLAAFCEDKLK